MEELGCDPGVMPLLRSLWYRCLNHSRLLHPEFCQWVQGERGGIESIGAMLL